MSCTNRETPVEKSVKQNHPYAYYLIVQNADPSKEVVALGQTYFAVQTRIQELKKADEYNQLSTEDEKRIFLRNAAKDAGVISALDYAIFQNHGYKGLYGGFDAKYCFGMGRRLILERYF